MNRLFILSLSAAHTYVSQVFLAAHYFKTHCPKHLLPTGARKTMKAKSRAETWMGQGRRILKAVQLWQLPINYWKLNFNISAEDSHRFILHTHTKKVTQGILNWILFLSLFLLSLPFKLCKDRSHWKKKLVRALHLSLVGVYKINIIPPMGEKVRFIPRQGVVWQTKFVSIKISYWDFSIYIKKKLQICIYFHQKKNLNQNESLDKMRVEL